MNHWPPFVRKVWSVTLLASLLALPRLSALNAQDKPLTDRQLRARIENAMRDGTAWLRNQQDGEGAWGSDAGAFNQYRVGFTSLAILALINCDVPVDSEPVQRGLNFLRQIRPDEPKFVYEGSLYIMALCATEPTKEDFARIDRMTRLLVATQCTERDSPKNSGLWGYDLKGRGRSPGNNSEDHSNGQFAVLALRDAVHAGVQVDRKVWERVQEHWLRTQLPDGGWNYSGQEAPRGSMTTAGLATLAITTRMLQDDKDVDEEGRPDCCQPRPSLDAFEKGRQWMAKNFTVYSNPGEPGRNHYYYLYGLERAARLGHLRFFGNHDWYREGADYLQKAQRGDGSWSGQGHSPPQLATPFALLFLSKGLSRIVVNKLDFQSPPDREDLDGDWNRHPFDVTNLIEKIDGLERWPPRLNSQVLTLSRLEEETAVSDMNQAPVLFFSGRDALPFTDTHVKWLREYVDEGGFIFASANCDSKEFDASFRELMVRMFPQGEAKLQRLGSDHPVFRSEYNLGGADTVELFGVDFGCRTSIIYSPVDLGCLWQKWTKHNFGDRPQGLPERIFRATSVGVNVIAYATGREPPVKLNSDGNDKKMPIKVDRNSLEIAQLRYRGNWDIAPKALDNLLAALNKTAGMSASPKRRTIPITLSEMKRFPIVYMHGRYRFVLEKQEQDALRDYLSRGAVLFADACCGSQRFDQGFRELMTQLFPEHPLQKIPLDHELYSDAIGGHKIETVKRRRLVPGDAGASIQTTTDSVPPLLEGIEIDGRYVVIYSQYDISCALENQASLACDGYEEADAMRLAVNIVLYSMLQEISAEKRHSAEPLKRPDILREQTPTPLLPVGTEH